MIESSQQLDFLQPYVDKIKEEFDDVLSKVEYAPSFSSDIRGPYGVAHIHLKDDARPVHKKFYRLVGSDKKPWRSS